MNIIYLSNRLGYIGKDGKLLYRLSEDLKRFRKVTSNGTVIMGYKTFSEIGKALPQRENIVIADLQRPFTKVNGVNYVSSLEEALRVAETFQNEVFIVGGATVYNAVMDKYKEKVRSIYATLVEDTTLGDTLFQPNLENFYIEKMSATKIGFDEVSGVDVTFRFITYKNRSVSVEGW